MNDTKAYWKRRALKAESEVQTMRNIRSVDNTMEIKLVQENSALRTVVNEIREAVDSLGALKETE